MPLTLKKQFPVPDHGNHTVESIFCQKRKQIHSLDLISSALNNKNTESEVQKDKLLSQLSLLDHIRDSDYTSLNEDQKSSINSLAEATKNLYDLLNSEINFEAIA